MDPRLVTRGSNDLGGAMFKGSTFGPAFLIRQKGEKESKSVKSIQEMLTASPNYKAKVKSQATPKARFVFAKFDNFICFRFLFVIIKKGEIVEAT